MAKKDFKFDVKDNYAVSMEDIDGNPILAHAQSFLLTKKWIQTSVERILSNYRKEQDTRGKVLLDNLRKRLNRFFDSDDKAFQDSVFPFDGIKKNPRAKGAK